MMNLLINISIIAVGYVVGSIPSAYIVGRLNGVDIRETIEDGRRGASFVWKTVGKPYGILVAAMDFSKGLFSIMLAQNIFHLSLSFIVLTGLAAIIGHNWSIFLKFTGGQGAATTFGNLLYLLPRQSLLSAATIAIPLIFVRKKKYFKTPFLNKEVKTSNFFTAFLYFSIFFYSLVFDLPLVLALAPIVFSLPMILKVNNVKKNGIVDNYIPTELKTHENNISEGR
jgi:acyl-phosphate glycerol 3-phosphate acyltransferase